jgi:autotransporter-associated beta strand protein
MCVASVRADVYTWNSDASGNWSTPGSWTSTPGDDPNGDTADARIQLNLTAARTISLTENVTVNALRLNDTTTPHYRLEVRPTSPYTLTFGGAAPVIESLSYSGGDGALQVYAPVIVGAEGLTKIGGGSAAFMNTITGSGTLTFSSGTTELRAESPNFTGQIVINSGGEVQARALSGTGATVLGDTAHATTINGNGRFRFRDITGKATSEPFVINGIHPNGSIMMYAAGSVTINGPITLNSDVSFSQGDWVNVVGGVIPPGAKKDFFINSVISEGMGGPHKVYFLGEYSSTSAQGTQSRKGEMVLGAVSTYGGNTYITTNKANDATGSFSGNLRLGIDNPLPAGTTVVLGGSYSTANGTLGTGEGNGKLALGGHALEVAGLLTNGTGKENRVVGNSTTLSTLTLNIPTAATNAYAGFVGWTDVDDNNLALVKKGGGTLTLGGTNTYTGGTTVSAGVLRTTAAGALGSGAIAVSGGAQLQLDAVGAYTVANPLTLNGGGGAAGDGAVTSKAAGANVTLTGPITLTGGTSIKARGDGTTQITVAGGVNGSANNYSLSLYSDGGRVVLSTNPVNLGTGTLGGGFDLNVAGNVASKLFANWGQTVKLGADNPFTAPPVLELGNVYGATCCRGRLDLNGHSFTAGSIAELNTNWPGNSEVLDSTGGGVFILNNASGATSTFTGKLTGNLSLTKQGAGTLILAGANTYTGTTAVEGGKLLVNGAHSGAGAYTVGPSGTLGGTGTIGGNVALETGGKLSPGLSPGVLSIGGNLDLSAVGSNNAGDLIFELGSAQQDLVRLTSGLLDIGTNLLGFSDFSFQDIGLTGLGAYVLIDTTQPILGSLDPSDLTGMVGGLRGTLSLAGPNNQDLVLNFVPEPSTACSLLLTLLSLTLFRASSLVRFARTSILGRFTS